MSIVSKFLRAGATLTAANTVQQGLGLVRNIVIARLLGPEEFGVVATFMILMTAFTMMSDLGVEKFLLRAPFAALDRTQNMLHSVVLVRGVLIGLAIVMLAEPFAGLFGRLDLAGTYVWLAIVPVIAGLRHLDTMRLQRDLVYIPEIKVRVGAVVVGTAVAVGLALWLGDHTALIWAYIAETAFTVGLTHLLAQRRYRFGADAAIFRELMVYGWPLMLNGALMYVAGQGDRVLVGSLAGLTDLAAYVAMATVTVGIALFCMKIITSLYLPVLAAVQYRPKDLVRRNHICGAIATVTCIAVAVPLMLLGAPLVLVLYGPDYQVSAALAAWLGLQAGARVLRSWPSAVALASGFTRDILYSNIIRSTGLGAAFLLFSAGYGVLGVAAAMALSELLSTVYALWRSDTRARTTGWFGLKCGVLFSLMALLTVLAIDGIGLMVSSGMTDHARIGRLITGAALIGLGVVGVLAIAPDLRRRILIVLRSRIQRIL